MVCVSRFLASLEMTTMQKNKGKVFSDGEAVAKHPLSHIVRGHVERSETSNH